MPTNEWDDYAEGWDENPQTSLYASNAFQELQREVQIRDMRVLDFGCGTGLLTEKLSPQVKEIVALDGSSKMIEVLNQKKFSNVRAISGFLTNELLNKEIRLQDKFDLIVASSVCAFLPDYVGTLKILKNMLSTTGTFVQWDWLVSNEDKSPGFSLTKLRSDIEIVGFKDVQLTTPFEIEGKTVIMAIMKLENGTESV